jgi:hypothetical protein
MKEPTMEEVLKLELIKLLDEFTQEMDRYSGAYYASIQSPGISAEDYGYVADLILEKFFLKQRRGSDE